MAYKNTLPTPSLCNLNQIPSKIILTSSKNKMTFKTKQGRSQKSALLNNVPVIAHRFNVCSFSSLSDRLSPLSRLSTASSDTKIMWQTIGNWPAGRCGAMPGNCKSSAMRFSRRKKAMDNQLWIVGEGVN